jgi:hypothetical protein
MINSIMVVVVSYTKGIFQDNEQAAGAKQVTAAVKVDTIRSREIFILCGLDSQVDNRNSKLLLRGMSSKHLQVAGRLSSVIEKSINS